MLGREIVQPIHLPLGTTPHCFKKFDPDSWKCHLAKSLCNVHQMARSNLRAAQHRQKRDYDLRLVDKQYVMGDLVYKLDSSTKIGQIKKLRSPWVDPFVVPESFPPLYRIRERGGDTVIHHDRLRRCDDRTLPIWRRRIRNQLLEKESVPEMPSIDPDGTLSYRGSQDGCFSGVFPSCLIKG